MGLKTLSVLNKCLEFIKLTKGIVINLDDIPLDDTVTYNLIASGNSLMIFQIEGAALTNFAAKCRPKNIDDISAIISLYRPGPMGLPGYLESYISRSNGDEESNFIIPKYNYIFKDTYGLMVYQEQCMILAKDMCGFTDIEADALRVAIGKKDAKKLAALSDKFIEGAVSNGEDRKTIEKLWHDMEEFAR